MQDCIWRGPWLLDVTFIKNKFIIYANALSTNQFSNQPTGLDTDTHCHFQSHACSSICHCVGPLVRRLVSHLCFRRFPGDFRITSPAQSHAFLFFVVQLHVFLLLLFGQRPLMEPKGTKSCRIQGESIRPDQPFICLSPPPQRLALASQRLV